MHKTLMTFAAVSSVAVAALSTPTRAETRIAAPRAAIVIDGWPYYGFAATYGFYPADYNFGLPAYYGGYYYAAPSPRRAKQYAR